MLAEAKREKIIQIWGFEVTQFLTPKVEMLEFSSHLR